MPLYEYQCEACGKVTERIQKFSDPPMETCPACGGLVKKLLSSPAIQFKGSGWYITDYARKSGNGAGASATTDKGSSTESTGKAEGSTKSDSTAASSSTSSSSTSSKSD
jgi:putative FmdB family regulatory protein